MPLLVSYEEISFPWASSRGGSSSRALNPDDSKSAFRSANNKQSLHGGLALHVWALIGTCLACERSKREYFTRKKGDVNY